MLSFFKIKRQKEPDVGQPFSDQPNQLSQKVGKLQKKFCTLVSSYEQLLTNNQKKICFILFTVTFGLYFTFIMINTFLGHSGRQDKVPVHERITPPKDIALPDSLNIPLLRERFEKRKLTDTTEH